MSANNQYFVVAKDQLLCTLEGELVLLSDQEFSDLALDMLSRHRILGDNRPSLWVMSTHQRDLDGYQWLGLRAQLGLISDEQFQLAGRALQLLRWHYDHQYCGRCGQATVQHPYDLAKTCVTCALDVYPRLSPCIITLVVRGDYCLLALHKRSTRQTRSCLAGFIEIGESPEQTLVREVREEVGVAVTNIRYVISQPWPFPGQLMLGYFADYVDGDIVVEPQEIVAADWYRYDQLPDVPNIATISGRLIDIFVQQRKALHLDTK